MTSPVDTSVKYYDSTMANAPVLNGVVGAMIALIDACGKDGFSSVTLTSLVVAGNVATAQWSGTHAALKDCVVLLAGATGGPTGFANVNGEQKVTAKVSGTTLTFATSGISNGTITGTITMKMAPFGLAKTYSGTNLAAYQFTDVTGTGMFLRVDDTGTTIARLVGYETMSDVNTGTNPFPSTAQVSGGGYWPKSTNANATAVAWQIIADTRCCYISVQAAYSSTPVNQIGSARFFGDGAALRPGGDAYAYALNTSSNPTVTAQVDGALSHTAQVSQYWLPREYTGLGSAIGASSYFHGNAASHVSGVTASINGAFPSTVDGSMILLPRFVNAPTSGAVTPRMMLPGLYHCTQSAVLTSFRAGNIAPGTGVLAGRNLVAVHGSNGSTAINTASDSSNTAVFFMDITGPWR